MGASTLPLLLVLLSALLSVVHCKATVLIPGQLLNNEVVSFGVGVARYELKQLRRGAAYEVRVSYPASNPAVVRLNLVQSSGSIAGGRGPSRMLLDTEKITFRTSRDKDEKCRVELTAHPNSIHRDGQASRSPHLVYNIALIEVVLGVPLDAIPTVALVLLSVLVVALLLPFWVTTAVPALTAWLQADQRSIQQRKHSL